MGSWDKEEPKMLADRLTGIQPVPFVRRYVLDDAHW
jgi:hypothetical protein